MKWMYHITADKSKHGFYRIPKTCVNAYHGNFEKLLEYDDNKLVKSAVVNWFNDKHGNNLFSVGMNGHDSIILFANDSKEHDYYFNNFRVIDDFLLHHDNEREYNEIKKEYLDNKIILQRKDKLNKLLVKIETPRIYYLKNEKIK